MRMLDLAMPWSPSLLQTDLAWGLLDHLHQESPFLIFTDEPGPREAFYGMSHKTPCGWLEPHTNGFGGLDLRHTQFDLLNLPDVLRLPW